MMRKNILFASALMLAFPALAQNVSITARNMPAEEAFRILMRQTDKNFVYNSATMKDVYVTVNARNEPLDKVLARMFSGTPVSFTAKGNNIVLRRAKEPEKVTVSGYVKEASGGESMIGAIVRETGSKAYTATNSSGFYSMQVAKGKTTFTVSFPTFKTMTLTKNISGNTKLDFSMEEDTLADGRNLSELLVIADKNKTYALESPTIGRLNISRGDILTTPVIFGEPDVIKTLQLEPGVTAGVEGMAGMYVDGGNHDENLYMLDNVPLYQVNHFGGLFSAFNTEAIKNVDFYKNGFPAKYNGRLSSILEVHTKDGDLWNHHGSFRLGLTSGALQIDGPIWKGHTTYSLAVRRSWFDVLTIPAVAIYNKVRQDKESHLIARYAFTDINAKVTHHFKDKSRLHAMFYYGEDFLKGGNETRYDDEDDTFSKDREVSTLHWGNIVGSLGYDRPISEKLFAEFTLAYTRYNSTLRREDSSLIRDREEDEPIRDDLRKYTSNNRINDVTLRADFGWDATRKYRMEFGANATHHTFLPENVRTSLFKDGKPVSDGTAYTRTTAFSSAAYVNNDISLFESVRMFAGLNFSTFHISGKTHLSLDPRASFLWRLNNKTSLKASYDRMSQYVHQLTESALSLPTDRWVPVTGDFKPQLSDKVALGVSLEFGKGFLLTADVYWKWMKNVLDYRDDYYLFSAGSEWTRTLCSGNGTAKGIDMRLSKTFGNISGHVSYSLLWSDRRFDEKNHGKKFPSKFDNRHKINVAFNWKLNDKWSVNAAWTGMSGNMTTLLPQQYIMLDNPEIPISGSDLITVPTGKTEYGTINEYYKVVEFGSGTNNYRLPFYHRLDLSADVKTKHGQWTFSVFNAYCNMNVVSIKRNDSLDYRKKAYKKFRLLPMIPSVSYTWFF